jgi:hypothetical protein
MSETTKEPTFPKKMVSLNVAVALGIICIVLIAGMVEIWFSYSQLNSSVSNPPYIHSQLLENEPPMPISGNSSVDDWVLNWTATTDVRIIGIQVWMGNPVNVTWAGDTYVTIGGEPSDPSILSSYNDTVQLLVHLQRYSHASTSPSQIMFDFTPGFKATPGQTIYVYRDFVNTEPYNVTAGDVQVIIFYENA